LFHSSSIPSVPSVLDEETRQVVLKRTADVLRELDGIRRSLELPPEMFSYVLEIYAASAREAVLEKERTERAKNVRRTPMALMSSDREYQPLRIKRGKVFSVIGRPQHLTYRVEEIEIDGNPARWRVHNIKVGNVSQGAESFRHPIPGERFRKGGIMSDLRFEPCQTAMDFVMEVEYVGPLDEGEVFEATLVGTAAL
jgi:hypothetical protein